MLSVLIPTYNYDCYSLVADLEAQLSKSGEPYEVIVADDGSTVKECIQANHRIDELTNCRYIYRKENVGRAAIRNFLVSESHGEWLLFIDCDARVIKEDFIDTYLSAIRSDDSLQLIVGGLCHPEELPSPDVTLRFRYEREADQHRLASQRSLNPFMHLTAFNLCVRRSLMDEVGFDENCHEYGYEDALLGIEFQERGAKILHIDNPLEHVGLESNSIYLSKVETSLRTLHSLGGKMAAHAHVSKAATRIEKLHLASLFKFLFKISKPLLRQNLLSIHPSLTMLKLYKLGYFLSIK